MPTLNFKNVILPVVAALSCAHVSAAPPPPKVIGNYDLIFIFDTNNNLVLRAHVTDSQGNPATDGVVIFEYCSYKGRPPNDITRPDEAPSSACADGSGKWIKLTGRALPVVDGDAVLFFSEVSIVNVIGFRYTYDRGSVVADWQIDPVDWIR